MIRAECHSDDRVFEINFDATLWFEQATADQLRTLSACDWGGDYPADEIAQFMDGQPNIGAMFRYCEASNAADRSRDHVGFECHVDQEDALAWLKEHRPGILTLIELIYCWEDRTWTTNIVPCPVEDRNDDNLINTWIREEIWDQPTSRGLIFCGVYNINPEQK